MLELEDLRIVRGSGEQAYEVRLPQLRLRAGDVMAVVGGSGCGKSTLLEGVGLLLAPQRIGRYALGDRQDVADLMHRADDSALASLRASRIGFMLQTGGLLPFLNVRENIMLPRRLLGMGSEHTEHIFNAIDTLGLEHLLNKRPDSLSIGERQRVAFVRAIAHEPGLLLADEPTSALDPVNARSLFQFFIDLARRSGVATLVVSHDWALVEDFNLPCLKPAVSAGLSVFSVAGAS